MTITTEEAETLARQLEANEPMVQDPVAIEFFGDVATALRSIAAERDAAIARADKAERERDDADRRAGAAERHMEELKDDALGRANWLRKAKSQRGYDSSTSFDVVWRDVCEKADRAEAAKAEAEKLREALTPSGDTKADYMGEFSFGFPVLDEDGNEATRNINVPWTTIKEIMAAIRACAALNQGGDDGREKAKRHHHDGIPDGLLMRGD